MKKVILFLFILLLMVNIIMAKNVYDNANVLTSKERGFNLGLAIDDLSKINGINLKIKLHTQIVDKIDREKLKEDAKELFYFYNLDEEGMPSANIMILFSRTSTIGLSEYSLNIYREQQPPCFITNERLKEIADKTYQEAMRDTGFADSLSGDERKAKYNEFLERRLLSYVLTLKSEIIENKGKLIGCEHLEWTKFRYKKDTFDLKKVAEKLNTNENNVVALAEDCITTKDSKLVKYSDYNSLIKACKSADLNTDGIITEEEESKWEQQKKEEEKGVGARTFEPEGKKGVSKEVSIDTLERARLKLNLYDTKDVRILSNRCMTKVNIERDLRSIAGLYAGTVKGLRTGDGWYSFEGDYNEVRYPNELVKACNDADLDKDGIITQEEIFKLTKKVIDDYLSREQKGVGEVLYELNGIVRDEKNKVMDGAIVSLYFDSSCSNWVETFITSVNGEYVLKTKGDYYIKAFKSGEVSNPVSGMYQPSFESECINVNSRMNIDLVLKSGKELIEAPSITKLSKNDLKEGSGLLRIYENILWEYSIDDIIGDKVILALRISKLDRKSDVSVFGNLEKDIDVVLDYVNTGGFIYYKPDEFARFKANEGKINDAYTGILDEIERGIYKPQSVPLSAVAGLQKEFTLKGKVAYDGKMIDGTVRVFAFEGCSLEDVSDGALKNLEDLGVYSIKTGEGSYSIQNIPKTRKQYYVKFESEDYVSTCDSFEVPRGDVVEKTINVNKKELVPARQPSEGLASFSVVILRRGQILEGAYVVLEQVGKQVSAVGASSKPTLGVIKYGQTSNSGYVKIDGLNPGPYELRVCTGQAFRGVKPCSSFSHQEVVNLGAGENNLGTRDIIVDRNKASLMKIELRNICNKEWELGIVDRGRPLCLIVEPNCDNVLREKGVILNGKELSDYRGLMNKYYDKYLAENEEFNVKFALNLIENFCNVALNRRIDPDGVLKRVLETKGRELRSGDEVTLVDFAYDKAITSDLFVGYTRWMSETGHDFLCRLDRFETNKIIRGSMPVFKRLSRADEGGGCIVDQSDMSASRIAEAGCLEVSEEQLKRVYPEINNRWDECWLGDPLKCGSKADESRRKRYLYSVGWNSNTDKGKWLSYMQNRYGSECKTKDSGCSTMQDYMQWLYNTAILTSPCFKLYDEEQKVDVERKLSKEKEEFDKFKANEVEAEKAACRKLTFDECVKSLECDLDLKTNLCVARGEVISGSFGGGQSAGTPVGRSFEVSPSAETQVKADNCQIYNTDEKKCNSFSNCYFISKENVCAQIATTPTEPKPTRPTVPTTPKVATKPLTTVTYTCLSCENRALGGLFTACNKEVCHGEKVGRFGNMFGPECVYLGAVSGADCRNCVSSCEGFNGFVDEMKRFYGNNERFLRPILNNIKEDCTSNRCNIPDGCQWVNDRCETKKKLSGN